MIDSNALASLPHGPGFRFVDEVLELEPGQSGTGRYTVRGDEAFLSAHFPGNPLMPGVILIEALAQLGGVVAQSDPKTAPLREVRLAAVQTAKITGSAVPGEILTIQAKVTGRLGPLVQVQGMVETGGRRLLDARITLSGTVG
ncbi:MAG: fabZ [Verrucomicrobiales bacterium]|nr:fabZ [Verrucomicrobiales bacterium]